MITTFALVLLIILNILIMTIVIIALAGTKGKLDLVDMMLKMEMKRNHFKGLSPKYTPLLHKKTGNTYLFVATAINATNAQDGQDVVIYQNGEGQTFVRELTEMREKFEGDFDVE